MAYILALETSSKICSAALFENNQLLHKKEEGGEYSHAEKLAAFVEEILQISKVEYKELSAVAISKGPGSYTGLRIGTSTAKGICYALGIPLISIPTLQAMAFMLKQSVNVGNALICPMIDARRMEVYTAIFDSGLNPIKETSAEIVTEDFLDVFLEEHKVFFCGDGSAKAEHLLKAKTNAVFSTEGMPSAEGIGALAYEKFQHSQFEDVAYFEPFYLKDFIAGKPKKLL